MSKSFSNLLPQISDYVSRLYAGDEGSFGHIRTRAASKGLPDIHVGVLDGLLLELFVRSTGARQIVEVGTLAGYSGSRMAKALPPGGMLYTFEFDPRHAEVARETFEIEGLQDRTKIFVGPAIENLPRIENEGPFDLIFIDADKGGYVSYLEWAANNLRIGGTLLADNTFAFGMISDQSLSPTDQRSHSVKALREFNQKLAAHPRFRSTILPTGEGLSFAVKIK